MTKKSRKSAGGSSRGAAPAPAEWLATSQASHGGVKCLICTRPELSKVVGEFAGLGAQLTQIVEYLRAYYDYPFGASTVGNHIRRHAK